MKPSTSFFARVSLAVLGGCIAAPLDGADEGAAGSKADERAEDCPDCFPIQAVDEGWREPGEDEVEGEVQAGAFTPPKFNLIERQSAVQDQQRRGVCSIFSTVGFMEHLYLVGLGEFEAQHEGPLPAGLARLFETDTGMPRFSEQFLQWSVKNEISGYPWKRSEGSSSHFNLRAIKEVGIVTADKWAYSPSRWNSHDVEEFYRARFGEDEWRARYEADGSPTCEGDDRPTICWTNGAPSEEVRDPGRTLRWTLPDRPGMGDFIFSDPNTIKSHMFETGTSVVVGLDFYYQAWNHRGAKSAPDTLPRWCEELPEGEPCALVTSDDRRARGIVGTPNAEDRAFSSRKRAGHSIVLVGWDDEKVEPRLDRKGEETGEVDQGFFLFKNSWGTDSFGTRPDDNVPLGYGWISYDYVRREGTVRIAEPPKFEIVPEVCGNQKDDDWDGLTDDADTGDCGDPVGGSETFTDDTRHAITDHTTTEGTITVNRRGTTDKLSVSLDIEHSFMGDLDVVLHAPDSTRHVLRHRQGGNTENFHGTIDVTETFQGHPSEGDWTLEIHDGAADDEGFLVSWSLTFAPSP